MKNNDSLKPDDTTGNLDRRRFLHLSGCAGIAGLAGGGEILTSPHQDEDKRFIREALHYEKLDHKKIRCQLCPRQCEIDDRERGYCGVRENRGGTYYTLVYSRPCTYHADPIEKKPLFHFHPGSSAFSLATAGCNVNCKFCQNWQISQVRPEALHSYYLPPSEVVRQARDNDCLSIAYTYSEPTVFYEYMLNSAVAGRRNGVKNVVITAGYIESEPLIRLCRQVDAIKVDLKSFNDDFYHEVVNGELKPVLDSLVTIKEQGVWLEIVYLLLPTLNDSEKEIRDLSRWITANLGLDVPVHFTRFYPSYRLKNLPPTPFSTLERSRTIAMEEGINFVYVGNVPGHPGEHTYCPSCGKIVINRTGYLINSIAIVKGACRYCGTAIPGIWGD